MCCRGLDSRKGPFGIQVTIYTELLGDTKARIGEVLYQSIDKMTDVGSAHI